VDKSLPEARFRPDRRYTALAGVGCVAAVVVLTLSGDPAGRLLAAIALFGLAVFVATDVVFAPRLVVSGAGIVVNSPFTRAALAWSEVERVSADRRSRLGLTSTTLEIDAGSVLAVLSRRALGADPAEVAALVEAFRPPSA
jgi:nitrogen fixation protein FixH